MAKKRSILTTFVVALLIIAVMLSLTPLPVSAKTSYSEPEHTTGVVTASLLHVRDGPSVNSNIIGTVREGNLLTIEKVIETSDKVYTIWLKINYNGKVGYVSKNYVNFVDANQDEETITPDTEPESYIGIVTACLLNVRDNPSITSNTIGNVKEGNLLTIEEVIETSDKVYATWLKINYNGKVGYVAKNYVNFVDTNQDEEQITPDDSKLESYIGIVTASGLNLRTEPTTNSSIIAVLKNKSLVNVLEVVHTSDKVNSIWLKVNFNNSVGYVAQQYVDIFDVETTNTSKQVGVVTTNLNLRTNPTTTNSQIKEILPKGTCVNILNSRTTSNQKWYQVRSPKGIIGWVSGKYLQIGKWSLISSAITQSSPNGNRDHNIALASSFINGEVILPEDDFSWFETVGACTAKKGFLVATIYVNGEISKGYGGGVCQVSTTINMATKRAGIKTNAHQHSLPVSYASREDEATVSYPYQNFSFENTLQTPIMLEVISSGGCCMCNVYKLV